MLKKGSRKRKYEREREFAYKKNTHRITKK